MKGGGKRWLNEKEQMIRRIGGEERILQGTELWMVTRNFNKKFWKYSLRGRKKKG